MTERGAGIWWCGCLDTESPIVFNLECHQRENLAEVGNNEGVRARIEVSGVKEQLMIVSDATLRGVESKQNVVDLVRGVMEAFREESPEDLYLIS